MSNVVKSNSMYKRRSRRLNHSEISSTLPESQFEIQRKREGTKNDFFKMPSTSSMLQTLATSSETLSRVANMNKEKTAKKRANIDASKPHRSNKPSKISSKSHKNTGKENNFLAGQARTSIFKDENKCNVDISCVNSNSNQMILSDIDSDDYEDEFIPIHHNKPKPTVPMTAGMNI